MPTQHPWETAESRTVQKDILTQTCSEQISLHSSKSVSLETGMILLQDHVDSVDAQSYPVIAAAPQTNSTLCRCAASMKAVAELECELRSIRWHRLSPYCATGLGTSYLTAHQSHFLEPWARVACMHRTHICTSQLQASFPKDQKLLPMSRGNCVATVHTSSCMNTHNYPVFTCKYPSAHGFFGKCQLHRCNPGARI